MADVPRIVRSPFTEIKISYNEPFFNTIAKNFIDHANKIALDEHGTNKSLTYKELGEHVERIAYNLDQQGIGKDSTICIFSPNAIEAAIVIPAIWRLGAKLCYINPMSTTGELNKYLRKSRANALFVPKQLSETALAAVSGTGVKKIYSIGEAKGCESFTDLLSEIPPGSPKVPWPVSSVDDVCAIYFSSGTTGEPKAVLIPYRTMLNIANLGNPNIGFQRSPAVVYQPFAHAYGVALLSIAWYHGYKTIIMPQFGLEEYIEILHREKVTHLQLVPPVMLMLAKSPFLKKYDVSHVESIVVGAAPTTAELEALTKQAFGQIVKIRQGYGLTEAVVLAFGPDPELHGMKSAPTGSVGVPAPDCEIKVIDIDTGALLGPNKWGELCAKSPCIMKGYLDNPEATGNTIRDGWLHTGDIAYYDENGNFFIVDRLKELVKYKGLQVSPSELEGVMLQHPDIADVAVTSLPDDMAGELPHAWVVPKPGSKLTENDVQDYVSKQVAPYKKLRGGVKFVEEIPKSPNGKILRRHIKAEAWEGAKTKSKL